LVGRQFAMSLVSGIFVQQRKSVERATFIVCDPYSEDLTSALLKFPPEALGRASARVAYARDLSHFNMPSTVSTLMGIKGSPSKISEAVEIDLVESRPGAPVIENGHIIHRHIHSLDKLSPIKGIVPTGLEFTAELPADNLDSLRSSGSADSFGEEQWNTKMLLNPTIELTDNSASFTTISHINFTLSLLHEDNDHPQELAA
jgi:hypothetical protein